MNITNDILYIGVVDNKLDLFEGQYKIPNGISYNSYLIIDDKIALMDTVEINYKDEWIDKLESSLKGRSIDYLIIHHMEPDHSSNIIEIVNKYPNITLVASKQAFIMMNNFFDYEFNNKIIVKEGDSLSLGKHKLVFISASMVHWPEVIMSYDSYDKVLFSADAFGTFGVNINSWNDEARRYYFGIVGKYGEQVKALLMKIKDLNINYICSLHGPILNKNIQNYLTLYNKWSNYECEDDGVTIAYTSMYGNTRQAALLLKEKLHQEGIKKVSIYDLIRDDIFEAVSSAFRYSTLILATTTYNGDIFPTMKHFIQYLSDRNYQKRNIGFIENGSWAPIANKRMKELFSDLKNIHYLNINVRILSSLNDISIKQIEMLKEEILNERRR